MQKRPASTIDPSKIKTAAFVIEEEILRHNLSVLKYVKDKTGAKMYQALKTWATWPLFPITKEYLDGTEVSSLNEARLGYDEFNHEVHMYAPAYKDEEFADILKYCSTIIFNSFEQWRKFKPQVQAYTKATGMQRECGLRINPEYMGKDEEGGLWTPCAPGSRLGIRINEFEAALKEDPKALDGISGFHFHIFWDKTFDELEDAVKVVEKNFGKYFSQVKWVNFGGGQKISDDEYDVEGLITLVNDFQKKYDVTVHMEPGAAIVKNAGVLLATVLDVVYRDDVDYRIAILDMSFNAHTPDFLLSDELDMPVTGAKIIHDENELKNYKNVYQLAGGTCVTGDKLGHFHSFEKPLKIGDKVIMEDGIQYNLVQCTMFNGVQHPSIVLWKDGKEKIIREFTYQDYRARMG
jgi:carboxynorspermidine decarboxylase